MIKVTVNGKTEFTVENHSINGNPVKWDAIEIRENTFHVIRDNKGYNATVISFNPADKTLIINVNGNDYEISVKDKYDLLLQQLGINTKASSIVQQIKAPMPGLIVQVAIKPGSEVKKGEVLLILEAMKMENVLKSPRDGKIKKVAVETRQTVEKNQLLIEFED